MLKLNNLVNGRIHIRFTQLKLVNRTIIMKYKDINVIEFFNLQGYVEMTSVDSDTSQEINACLESRYIGVFSVFSLIIF